MTDARTSQRPSNRQSIYSLCVEGVLDVVLLVRPSEFCPLEECCFAITGRTDLGIIADFDSEGVTVLKYAHGEPCQTRIVPEMLNPESRKEFLML